MKDDFITQTEFAKRIGVSQQAVWKAMKNGRISKRPEDGKLNWNTEREKWYGNKDLAKVREHNAPAGDDNSSSFNKAKLAKETFTAKLRQLEYEKEAGRLIPRDEVKISLFRFMRITRDAILSIPDRVSSELAARLVSHLKPLLVKHVGEKEANKILQDVDLQDIEKTVFRSWEKESREVLENLSKGPKL